MEIVPVPVLQDNYSYLLIDEKTRTAAVVDVSEVPPVLEAAAGRGVAITAILSTHHHPDHVGGNLDLARSLPGVRVFGNGEDAARIPGITDGVRDGEQIEIVGHQARVVTVPAHTSGHIAFHFPTEAAVFTGDTLFAGGCGRLFEGRPAEMMASLAKLASLPPATRVFCGHEYTVRNLEFATTLEPGNARLRERLEWARAERRGGRPTVPTTVAIERDTNPFLRVGSPELRASVRDRDPEVPDEDVAIFAAVRRFKDVF